MEQLGKYQLVRRIGTGGMAEVFLARTTLAQGLAKQLVIKKIHPAFARSRQFVSMFIDEAKIALGLNHPNIVQVFDFGPAGETYFLAMEYVEGVDLLRLGQLAAGQGKQLPLGLAVYVVQQLCKGLDYAHRKTDDYGEPLGIVHRDISQQNILVSWDGAVKIVDFGIARARGVHEEEGIIKGKFAYMSPEQARGDVVDSRSDVYSAGVVLFELMCNRPLYTGKGKELLEKVKAGALPRPRYLDPRIPRELEALVLKALAYHRDDRFTTARDMQYAMSKVQLQLAHDEGTLLDSAALAQFIAQVVPAEQRRPPPLPPSAEGTPASLRMRDGDTGGSLEDTDSRPLPPPTPAPRERKHVYVLEGSICGLPNLERRVGADRAATMVRDYLEMAKDIAFKHDAHVHRTDEAGFTLVVGLPQATEDDGSRAIRLALALVDALDGIGHDVEPELRLAVGIQSGMATARREPGGKLNYELSPATTAIARRLSREAQGAEVLVGGRVFRVAKGDFTFEELTTIDVPADPDTQPDAREEGARARVYRLRGPKERAERLRERSRGHLRLIGRELELKALRDLWRDVLVSRRKRQVLIAGDAGMGKRALVQAFLEDVQPGEAVIIRAAARVATAYTPYSVLVDLARDLLALADGASPAEVTRRVERAAALLYPTDGDAREVRGLVQMVCMLLGGQVPDDAGNIDPAERRQRLLEAMRKVESRLATDKPLIVIGEDVHWADDETQDLFRELLKVPTARPILGIVTARPEARVLDAARDTGASIIRLEELGEQDRLAMVVREFVPGEDVESLAREIVERAGGNPFFIREVLDSLIERGIVAAGDADDNHPGLLRWVRRDAPVQVPTSVEALLAARMDRLPPAEKETLLCAAVLGRRVSLPALDALLGRGTARDVEALAGRGLLRRDGDKAVFCNDMTMTVAYGLLPADERVRLHRRAAEQLAAAQTSADPDALRASPAADGVIARHLELAGDEGAVDRYLRAAGHAVEVGGSADAFRLLSRALKLLPPADHERRFQARRQREEILGRLARRGEQLREIHNMRKEAEALGDAGRLALTHCRLAQFYIDVGKAPAAARAVGPALEHARAAGDRLTEADALRLRAAIARLVGNNEESLALSDEALALCGDDAAGLSVRASILNNRGTTLWNMGRLVPASESYAEALVIYRALGLPRLEARALNNMGIIFAALGEFEEALAHYKSSLKIDQELGDRASIALKLGNIGQAYADLGDLERGERYLTKALKIAEQTEESTSVVDAAISLGQLHLQAGRPRDGLALLERGLALATEFRDRYQEIRALIYLALGQLDAGDPAEGALELARSATELARKSTMSVGEIYGLCAQGLALGKLGRADEGFERTREAVALLDRHRETEGAEVVLHMHARLCRQVGRTADAATALHAAWGEVQSKAGRLRDGELREIYLRSRVPAEIAADRGRLEAP